MKVALDKKTNRIISAYDVVRLGAWGTRGFNRFICPKCGRIVTFINSGGLTTNRDPYFRHEHGSFAKDCADYAASLFANYVIYNDADTHLYNLWYSILNFPDQLCALISNSPVTIEERIQQKKIYNNPIHTIIDDGFATLFLNRVNYSGVIKGGPIGGTKQTGNYKLDCRFRRTDLINTIQKISKLKNSIKASINYIYLPFIIS